MGVGTASNHVPPTPVEWFSGKHVADVAAGAEHSICVTKEGMVYGWGWGRYGNIGDGTTVDRHEPVPVVGLENVQITKVVAGWRHSLGLTGDGQLYVWGWNKYG